MQLARLGKLLAPSLIAGCLALLFSALGIAADIEGANTARTKVRAYSESFAKRFGLNEPSPEMRLHGDLYAIEFSVERPQGTRFYWCVLKAYLNSALPIALPTEDRAGSRALVQPNEHFMLENDSDNKRWLSLSLDDRRYFSAHDTFGQRAALASPDVDWPKVGYWVGLTYEAYYRELFPGITYIKLGSSCGTYAAGRGRAAPQLLLERTGGRDYTRIVKPDAGDFLKLEIAPSFYETTLKWAVSADQHNRDLIKHGYR